MTDSGIDRIVTRRMVHQLVSERLIERVFNQPLIGNVERGQYIECMVELALSELRPPWRLTDTWAGWDLEQPATGARIEVKQSAALQTWTAQTPGRSAPSFNIPPRAGYYADGGAGWVDTPSMRHADLYILARHGETDPQIADHRQPDQWQFFVIREPDLPPAQQTISLNPLRRLASPVPYAELAEAVRRALEGLPLKAAAQRP